MIRLFLNGKDEKVSKALDHLEVVTQRLEGLCDTLIDNPYQLEMTPSTSHPEGQPNTEGT